MGFKIKVNLSQIGELSRAIKESEKMTGQKISTLQKRDLVSAICGKTTPETQKKLSIALDIEIKERDTQRIQKDESVRVEITLSTTQFQKLSRCKDLAAHLLEQSQKDSSWASIIEVLADQYLNRKEFSSSSHRAAVQAETAVSSRTEFKTEQIGDSKMESKAEPIAGSETESINKSLTPKVRRKILDRDKCCQFRDPITGR